MCNCSKGKTPGTNCTTYSSNDLISWKNSIVAAGFAALNITEEEFNDTVNLLTQCITKKQKNKGSCECESYIGNFINLYQLSIGV